MIPVINKKYYDMIPISSDSMSMCRKAKMSHFIECWWSIIMSVKCISVDASHLLSTGYCLNFLSTGNLWTNYSDIRKNTNFVFQENAVENTVCKFCYYLYYPVDRWQ